MMMRMLEAGGIPALVDEVRAADEDNPNGYYEYESVKRTRDDASWLNGAAGRVVKMVHLLLYDLPPDRRYRVVFMRRSLDEIIRSQNVMLIRNGKSSVEDLPRETLIAEFARQLDDVDRYLGDHGHFSVLDVNYNDLMRDPAATISTIDGFFHHRLHTPAMMSVVDPKLYRQRA
jgi:hypothetical protein